MPITVEIDTLRRWYAEGVAKGATSMTILTDTFPHKPEQYPEYATPRGKESRRQAMQVEGNTYDLTRPLEEQILFPNQVDPNECTCFGPCGCS